MQGLRLPIACFLLSFFGACSDQRQADIPYEPWSFETEQQGDFFLPPDLEIVLWAESPMLYNPTSMDIDEKGRVWIAEAVNYRDFNNPAGKNLHFQEGDRIVILEDTDHDGKADSSKVFVQDPDLRAPLGIAVIGNQVIVSAAPHMIIYTDEDGDDRPDKKEIFLTGFGGYDHDHSLHSLVAGPDGLWYFNTGNAGPHLVTDKSGWTLRSGSSYTGGTPYNLENEGNQKSDDGRVWVGGLALRIQPDGKGLTVMAHNFRNAYELALDSYGTIWQNDNDDQVVACRVSYVMEGGNAGYFSQDGTRTWQVDQKPEQSIPVAHWHQDDPGVLPAGDITGAGSPTGFLVYEGDALGPDYRGMLLSVEAGRNVIFAYRPQWKGAGYGLDRKDLITTIGEPTDAYKWDEIFQDTRRWFRPSDAVVGTDGSLYIADWYDPVVGGHQMHDSTGKGRIFRVVPKDTHLVPPKLDLSSTTGQIAALCNPAVNVRNSGFVLLLQQGASIIPEAKQLLEAENPFHRARAVWLLAQLGEKGKGVVQKVLEHHPDPRLRVAAYRALKQTTEDLPALASLAADDPSAAVRREVALSLRDLSWEESKTILLHLAVTYPEADPWYLEALGIAASGKESELFEALLGHHQQAFTQWPQAMVDITWRLHPPEATDALLARARAENDLPLSARKKAADALSFIPEKQAALGMLELAQNGPEDLRSLATYWVAHRKTNDWLAWADELPIEKTRAKAELPKALAGSDPGSSTTVFTIEAIANLSGNAEAGKSIAGQKCISCHQIEGTGTFIGPELTSIGAKFDRNGLLDAIINPSAAITFGYEAHLIETTSGEQLYGFLIGDGQTKVLKDLTGNQHVIPAKEIASKQRVETSLMPTPQSLGLSDQDLADLVQYLSILD